MSGSRKVDLNALANEEGVRTDVTIKSPEDADEKKIRLHKELASFWVKELGPFLAAALILTVLASYPMFGVTPGTACWTRTYGKCLFGMQPHAMLRLRSRSDNMRPIIPYQAKV
jgi:hypothetical protein